MEGEEGERKDKLKREDSRKQTRREVMCTQDNVTKIAPKIAWRSNITIAVFSLVSLPSHST